MKTILLFCLMITLGFCSCSKKKNPEIEGAWKQIMHQSTTGDSTVTDLPGKSDDVTIKIWSGNQFMFVSRSRKDTTVEDNYGSGTFKLEGNRYEEHINILGYKPWEGKTVKMLLEIKNDTLTQCYPVDDNGQLEKDWHNIEKYVRLDK